MNISCPDLSGLHGTHSLLAAHPVIFLQRIFVIGQSTLTPLRRECFRIVQRCAVSAVSGGHPARREHRSRNIHISGQGNQDCHSPAFLIAVMVVMQCIAIHKCNRPVLGNHLSRFNNSVRFYAAQFCRSLQCIRSNSFTQFFQAHGVLFNEGLIIPAFFKDDMDHSENQRQIRAGGNGQPCFGLCRIYTGDGIHQDKIRAVLHGVQQSAGVPTHGIGGIEAPQYDRFGLFAQIGF